MNKMNSKTGTLEEYLVAQDEAIMGMVEAMRMLNRTEEDEETMLMMLDLIVQVTTKIQGILFGEDAGDDEMETMPEDESFYDPLMVIDDEDGR